MLLTILVLILSWALASLKVQSSYSVINPNTLELGTEIVKVKNLLSADGVKLLIGNAATNMASFSAFINLIVALIGLSVAHASGFIKAFIRRNTLKKHLDFSKCFYFLTWARRFELPTFWSVDKSGPVF